MNKAIQFPILLSLGLIWLAQTTFVPLYLSAIFLTMIVALFLHYRQIAKTETRKFPQWMTVCLVLSALASVWISYNSFWGLEAGVAVLSTFLFAKALESKNKRDLIILFNFALFVSASLFLYSQTFWMAVVVLMCLLSCLFGLYRIQMSEFEALERTMLHALKIDFIDISKFVVLAIPFFIVLFIFFPRFPPLWQVPIASHQGVTGISDRMSPGDIAELSQSTALAFRIIADLKQLPVQNELYWRAMVLDHYDGNTWTSREYNQYPARSNVSPLQIKGVEYQYLAADPRQKWVSSLEKSIPNQRRFILHQDYSITPNRLVQQSQPIQLLWMGTHFQNQHLELSSYLENALINFPMEKDVQAQQFAHQLFQKSQSDPQIYIKNLLQWYQQENFIYTLKPGVLGENRIDEFLFKSKQGFCEHYASSFVLMMRYVGIPARVVVGYQGGQEAPDGKSWEVRQLDAHAWTEVFLNGRWQRIDPTAIIAPQRLDTGMQNYMSNQRSVFGDDSFAQYKYQQFSVFKTLRVWSDFATYQWQSKVVGYDTATQKQWMQKFGLNSAYSLGILLILSVMGVGILYFILSKIRVMKQLQPYQRSIIKFSKSLSSEQQKQESETFSAWLYRLNRHLDDKKNFEQVDKIYNKIVYQEKQDKETIKNFERLLKECSAELNGLKKTCQKN